MSESGDPTQIRQDIEATREELGETVEALAAKTDVTGQAKRKLQDTRDQITNKAEAVTDQVKSATPESATTAAGQTVRTVRRNPALLAFGAFAIGFLVGRRST